jgi:hypothetical protein
MIAYGERRNFGVMACHCESGSGASADNSLRSAAEAIRGTLASDVKRLEIGHFCFPACESSIRPGVFAGPKSLDAPEPVAIGTTEHNEEAPSDAKLTHNAWT